jgi:hypothetical protein
VITTVPTVAGRRPWLIRQQLPYLQRAVRWRPVLAASAAALLLAQADAPAAFVLAAVASGLAFVLDDPAAAILDATPASRPRRRALRLALTVPLAALLWVAVVQPLWSSHSAEPAGGPARLALAALVAVVLAAAAVGGGVAGGPAAWAVVIAGTILPAPWGLSVAPGQSRNWIILLALAGAVLLILSRDPAAFRLGPRRRTTVMAGALRRGPTPRNRSA